MINHQNILNKIVVRFGSLVLACRFYITLLKSMIFILSEILSLDILVHLKYLNSFFFK